MNNPTSTKPPIGLRDYLSQRFSEFGGKMPFETFMADSLFDRDHGYYTANIETIGTDRGDFSTSPTVTRAFGKALATWFTQTAALHPRAGSIDSVEVGGGSGALSETFFGGLSWQSRLFHRHWMIETSPILRKLQKKNLPRFSRTRWLESLGDEFQHSRPIILFSNELVDAFPAIRLQWNRASHRWNEIHIEFSTQTGLSENFVPLQLARPHIVSRQFEALRYFAKHPPSDGQRIELHDSYRKWLKDTIQQLPAGSDVLTIDYGADSAAEIYERRPGGTLRAYHKQRRLEGADIYRRFGWQDLTADVNFTDLREWGEAYGMETISLQSQAEFLRQYLDEKPSLIAHPETQYLLSEEGAGTAFRVLHQRKTRHETDV